MRGRFAAIDVGSNSVLLHVAERLGPGAFRPLDDRMAITRLGEGVATRHELGEPAMTRTLEALRGFLEACGELGVVRVVAVGTQALRVAKNARAFLERAARELGLEIEVVTGEEEARLSYLAARASLRLEGRALIVDVGGGSTELVSGCGRDVESRESLPIGALTLTERYLDGDPVPAEALEALRAFLEGAFAGFDPPGAARVVGLGGAITTLAAVALGLEPYDPDRVHGLVLALDEVERQIALYASLPLAERRAIRGLHPDRAEIILAGAAIVAAALRAHGAASLLVCERGLRHGLLVERFGG